MGEDIIVTVRTKISKKYSGNRIYLGKWCVPESQLENLNNDIEIYQYHWDDIDKRRKDNAYLRDFNTRVLSDLITFLNSYHSTNYSLRYWKIIIGPWLLNYTSMMFDRWEVIRSIKINSKPLLFISNEFEFECACPNDYSGFITLSQDENWNCFIYSQILKEIQSKGFLNNVKVVDNSVMSFEKSSENKYPWHSTYKESKLRKLVNLFDSILGKISSINKVIIYEVPFTWKAYLGLNFKLRLIPSLYKNLFSFPDNNYDSFNSNLRDKFNFKFSEINDSNPFENFIEKRILFDMPSAYIENYEKILEYSNKIRFSPKLIVSAKGHWWNELFKVWIAQKQLSGTRMVFASHGGSIPLEFELNEHEEDVSDVFFSWFKPFHVKQIQVPPSRFICKQKNVIGDKLLVIGNEIYRYPILLNSGYMSADSLVSLDMFLQLYSSLSSEIKESLLYRPYANIGWNIHKILEDRLGNNKVVRSGTLNSNLNKAKLILCTYPETTFLESILSGIPTILLVNEKWKFHNNFDFLLDILIENNIIFYDSQKASNHINLIWDSPVSWWESDKIKYVRQLIQNNIGDISNGLDSWYFLLRSELNK